MSWIAAGVASAGLTLSAVKWISGNSKEKKAKRERDRLAKPIYAIQDEYYQNRNLAGTMAQSGLPAASKDYYTNESQRGLSAGVKGILGSGGNPNDIQGLFEAYDNGIGKIGVADAEAQINNIKYYMGVNKDLAGQKTIQWAINKQQPYLNTLKELNAAQAAGEATKNQALSDAMSTVTSFGTSMAGGSGAGGFGSGKKTGGGNPSATGKKEAWGNGASTDKFNIYAMGKDFWPENNKQENNTPTATTDPFVNDQNEYADYLKWKQFNGQ
jgi:hypothetical protein